jgi:uncharacterized membrane protein YeaQ/YmgE (transglycosylase-associated protein family)
MSRIPAVIACLYAVLVALSIVPVFTGSGALSGAFLVLLGAPWAQLTLAAVGATGRTLPGGASTGLVLCAIGGAVNAAILYFVARWVIRLLPS